MPSAADAFLADILEHPDDDGVRLIFADWLQDHGDPDSAEFIRLQVARSAAGSNASASLREAELLAKHRAAWEQDVPAWARHDVRFQRGFIEHIECSARDFLKGADGLFKRAPVQSVVFRAYRERTKELGESPYLACLRALTLSSWYSDGLDARGARDFFHKPALENLRTLDLGVCRIGPSGMKAVANCAALAGTTTLIVNSSNLGSAGCETLAGSPHFANLTHLDIAYSRIGDRGAAALAASPSLRGLRKLVVMQNEFTSEGASALAKAAWRLTSLSLAWNGIGDAGIAALAASASLDEVQTLALKRCRLSADGARSLAASEHLARLVELDLDENSLDDAGAIALAESPHLGSLRRLSLWANGVGDAGVRALANSRHLAGLTYLDIRDVFLKKATVALLRKRFGDCFRATEE